LRGALFSSSISWRLAKVMVLSIVANRPNKGNKVLAWSSKLILLFFSFLMKTHSISWAYLPDLTCWQAGGEFVYLSIFLDFDAIIWICCQFSLLSRSLEWNMFYQHGSLLGVQKRSSYYMPMCAWVWEFLHLITRKCEFSGN
jgi:hypothetical protein